MEPTKNGEREETPAAPRGTISELKKAWNRSWAFILVGAALVPVVVILIALGKKVGELDSALGSVGPMQDQIDEIVETRLPDLEHRNADVIESFGELKSLASPEARVSLNSLIESAHEIRVSLDALRSLETNHKSDIDKIEEKLDSLTIEVAKLDALRELVDFIVKREVAFGRIDKDELTRFYTAEELDQFILDAGELIRSDTVPKYRDRVGRLGAMTAWGCPGNGQTCGAISLLSPSLDGKTTHPIEISVYRGPRAERFAAKLTAERKQEYQLAASGLHGDNFCAWVYESAEHDT